MDLKIPVVVSKNIEEENREIIKIKGPIFCQVIKSVAVIQDVPFIIEGNQ